MMRMRILLFLGLLLAAASSRTQTGREQHWLKKAFLRDVNGGTACAVCTVLAGLVEQLAEIHNTSVAEAVDMFCHFLPGDAQDVCISVVNAVAPAAIELLEAGETPDVVCHAIEICKNDTGEYCRVFPPPILSPGETMQLRIQKARRRILPFLEKRGKSGVGLFDGVFIDICNLPIIEGICNDLTDHIPVDDGDKDHFSTMGTLRGSYWRGKDCDDHNKDIYPGRHTTDDATVDTNCNGILGVDPVTNLTYEEQWCANQQQMGTILLGDSAGAHFHIPPGWLTSREMSPEAYQDLILALENELDWPMMSYNTGFMNSSWPNSITGMVDSAYLRLRELNLCNHRDYQNVAWNGAAAKDMAEEVGKAFARSSVHDNPVFLSLALIGNDVCSSHRDIDHMTKPDDFYKRTLETLNFVDQNVAPGSIVIGVGLVDGRVLYDTLANRIHPIGSLHNDVTYSAVYDFLNCLDISPCFGWMNSNETWRNLTTERALILNEAFKSVASNNTFKNFKLFYVDPPLPQVFEEWEKQGGHLWDLIEPVDGFHPSQTANALTTGVLFKILAKLDGALPTPNPNNAKIRAKFGDQGGYL